MRISPLFPALILAAAGAAFAAKNAASDVDEVPEFKTEIRESDVAVVIGIETYRDLPASDFSAADAELFKRYLVAMGTPERNVHLITNERASGTDLKMALHSWLPNNAKPDGRVIVYFSGHGSPDPASGEAYLVPFDGNPNYLEDTAYSIKNLHRRLAALKAKEVIVLLDSCFSGAGGRSVLAKGARPLVTAVSLQGPLPANIAVMSASRGAQISTSSKERGHGLFTYHILKALREGKKSLSEIYEYVRPKVEDEAKGMNIEQSPSLAPALKPEEKAFLLADFAGVILPEDKKSELPKADAEAIRKEKERLEAEKKSLAEERARLAREAEEKENRLKDEKRRMEREARERSEAEDRRLAEERRRLKRKERELRKKRRRQSYENAPPPP